MCNLSFAMTLSAAENSNNLQSKIEQTNSGLELHKIFEVEKTLIIISKTCQIFIQVRKKCVILPKKQDYLQYLQGILDIEQPIIYPLLQFIFLFAKLFSLTWRCYGHY